MAFTLRVQNFRGLRRVEWSPSGVCALVGPNGSGKTTLLDVLPLLRDAGSLGFARALEGHGGAYGMRHFAAQKDEPVTFELRIESAQWTLQPEVHLGAGGVSLPFSERLVDGGQTIFDIKTATDSDGRLELLWSRQRVISVVLPAERPQSKLITLITSYRCHRNYVLSRLRREGSRLGGDEILDEDGRNLFTVLMNWHNRRAYLERWNFVLETLRDCFPEIFYEFSFPIAVNIVACEVHTPENNTLTPSLLPDGFLVALLHLCAVASARPGGMVAIDEPENALHPYAVRRLMDAFREWSDKHDVTVLLASHSPVLLDTFKEQPDKVFVLEPGHEVLPVPLDQLKKRNWLAHFALGDLYKHLEYGAPAGVDDE